jgi:hypothetical protein
VSGEGDGAAEGAGEDPIAEEIRALELRLLDPAVRGSATELGCLLSDDFREFGSGGRVYAKEETIRLLVADTAVSQDFSDFAAAVVAPGVVLATYRSKGAVRSSVWRFEDGRWRLYFHQGTHAPACRGD